MSEAKALAAVVRDYLARRLEPVLASIEELRRALAALPEAQQGDVGPRGLSAFDVAIAQGFSGNESDWIESLRGKPGADGRDGNDGHDADPDQIRAEIERAVAAIPRPKDGTSVSVDDVAPLIETTIGEAVQARMAALPLPKDGKDADPAAIAAAVEEGIARALPDAIQRVVDALMPELIAKVVAAVPQPRDGRDADPVDISAVVQSVLERIPTPRDGKDAEPIDAAALAREVLALVPVPSNGRDGRDADPEAIRIIIETAVAKAVAELPPPRHGRDAEPVDVDALVARVRDSMPTPKDGRDGRDGESVHPDSVRAMVLEAVQRAVADLPAPKDGEPGRDAVQVDYRDGIDEMKSYPRGTHALYRGGVIVALRATEPLVEGDLSKAGWAVAMNGVDGEAEETVDDGRIIRRTTTYTNGRSITREIKTVSPRHLGLYKADRPYDRGDIVTWGGESWHCNQDGVTEEPRYKHGGSSPWSLVTKKGRDGKDGKDAARAASPARDRPWS